MMRFRFWVVALSLVALLVPALTMQTNAAASDNLVRVMKEIGALNDTDYGRLKEWASEGARRPSFAMTQVDKVKNNILALQAADRDAVLAWLRGRGPGELYTRGILSSQLRQGSRSSFEEQFRELKFASETLQPPSSGDIRVLRGSAIARRSGTQAKVCVTFKNVGTKIATRVVFEFVLLNADGGEEGVMTLDRRGTFSPNVDIVGPDYFNNKSLTITGPRSMEDNCASVSSEVPAVPILSAQFASYRITRVEYADGTSWVPPAPAVKQP